MSFEQINKFQNYNEMISALHRNEELKEADG